MHQVELFTVIYVQRFYVQHGHPVRLFTGKIKWIIHYKLDTKGIIDPKNHFIKK